jgi:predicted lactoylglutathione lyase
MIEHTSLPVSDYKKARKFYSAALAPVGYKLNMEYGTAAGFMEGGHTSFWIVGKKKVIPTHIAFRAKNKKAVHEFHAAALKAGGKDNGAPGPRPDYSPDYYAAFVLDADGNNVEAVWFDPKKK